MRALGAPPAIPASEERCPPGTSTMQPEPIPPFILEPLRGWQEHPPEAMRRRAREFHADIARRRTVRDFDSRPVPRELIEHCLRAAGSAPSGANQQPWFFCVITDPGRKRRIREAAEAEERAFYGGRAPQEWLERRARAAGVAGCAQPAGHRSREALPRGGAGADRDLRAEVGRARRRLPLAPLLHARERGLRAPPGVGSGVVLPRHHARPDPAARAAIV